MNFCVNSYCEELFQKKWNDLECPQRSKIIFTKNSLRKIIPYFIFLIYKKYKIKGCKCIISGRINGVQIAKSETFKFNECSLQDKVLNIKYNFINIPTKYGLLGIKIWLFLN